MDYMQKSNTIWLYINFEVLCPHFCRSCQGQCAHPCQWDTAVKKWHKYYYYVIFLQVHTNRGPQLTLSSEGHFALRNCYKWGNGHFNVTTLSGNLHFRSQIFCLAYLDVVWTQDDPTTEHEPSVNGQGAHHEAKHIGEGCLQGQDQDLSTGTKTFFAFSKSQNRKQRARC